MWLAQKEAVGRGGTRSQLWETPPQHPWEQVWVAMASEQKPHWASVTKGS